jgi:hypothetical protein
LPETGACSQTYVETRTLTVHLLVRPGQERGPAGDGSRVLLHTKKPRAAIDRMSPGLMVVYWLWLVLAFTLLSRRGPWLTQALPACGKYLE